MYKESKTHFTQERNFINNNKKMQSEAKKKIQESLRK